jgi:4-amino-4-deoxychorismate lyase
MKRAAFELFGKPLDFNLTDLIAIPDEYQTGLFRCRVLYSSQIEKIEFLPHRYRKIESLKLIENNAIDYHLKYTDRSTLQYLFERKEECDDILIIKNGCITDSFAANTVFYDGETWWTPDTPLLEGTQRERLLKQGKIRLGRITPASLSKYIKVGLINAMQDLENMPLIAIENIKI